MAVPLHIIPIASFPVHAAPASLSSPTSSSRNTSESTRSRPALDRAIYIPYHTNATTHLPLYDITDQYTMAVGDLSIGTPRYKAQIRLMKKPSGNSVESDVRFLIDFHPLERAATIVERTLGRDGVEVNMSLSSTFGEGFSLRVIAPTQQAMRHVTAHSSPEPEKSKRKPARHNPLFSIDGGMSGSPALKWKPFPFEPGCLTYGLFNSFPSDDDNDSGPRALYQHCRHEGDFVISGHSEGILLVSHNEQPKDKALIVSSLIGLLWNIRCDNQSASKRRKSKFRNMFKTSL